MKLHYVTIITMGLLAGQVSADEATPTDATDSLTTPKDKISYIFGHNIGKNMNQQGIEINMDALSQGIQDGLSAGESKISVEETTAIMQEFRNEMNAKKAEKKKLETEKNTKEGKVFLAENAKKEGVTVLPSGLQYKVITPGTGKIPKADDQVKTHYRGTLIDGTEFDSSHKRNKPATFPVNGVISGWTEALQLMKEGAKWQLFIPGSLAYGERGAGGKIGPNATLIFDIELLEILKEVKEEEKK
ncbi:FKBP-type peptidyl-prolyl cis-trans isomerase [Candidatus Halobeggiatoa sp. HSG11]|nr:FKBP-type peptidyl-prolyl cis-trans isomerase [Candidatus Halobeggiatoa sp. HSG11]